MLLLLLLSTGGVRAVSRQRFAAARRARQGHLRRGEGSRRAGTLSEHAGQIAAATGEDPARVRQGPERCRSSAGATGQGPGRISQSKENKKNLGRSFHCLRVFHLFLLLSPSIYFSRFWLRVIDYWLTQREAIIQSFFLLLFLFLLFSFRSVRSAI